jgi:hypothetical protein
MASAIRDEAYVAALMTADKQLQFQNRLSDAGTEPTTWCFADTEHVTIQLESEIPGITYIEHKWFEKEFSIHLIEFEVGWKLIGIQIFRKTIQ